MKNTVLLLCLISVFSFTLVDHEDEIKNKIQGLLDSYANKSLREKLYVHIDNNLVEPGNSIWMKAYVTEQTTTRLSTLSKVLYTDVLTHQGDKVLGYKFLLEGGVADGAIYIPDSLEYENYVLSAYTQEMKDYDEAFTQVIEIRSYNSLFKKCDLTFDKEIYQSGDRVEVNIQTMDINNKPIGKVKYDYKLYNQGVVIAKGSGRTGKMGVATHQLSLDQNQFIHKPIIELTTNFNENKTNFYFTVPAVTKKELLVSFYPESRSMLEGVENRIGIRTTDLKGIPVNFRGAIVDEDNSEITEVVIRSNGIGSAQMTPLPGKIYYLEVPGLDKKFELPKASTEGYAMALSDEGKGEVSVRISKSSSVDSLVHVALISSGKVNYFSRLNLKQEEEVVVSTQDLESGIAEFCLFDRSGNRLLDRPIFIDNEKVVEFELNFSDGFEKVDETVELSVLAKDHLGNPVSGEFSMSITEDFSVFHKTFQQSNIVSTLLLESAVSSQLLNQTSFLPSDIFNDGNVNDALLVLDYKRLGWPTGSRTNESSSDQLIDEKEFLQGVVLDKNNMPQGGVDVIAIVKGTWDRSIITSDKFGFFTLPVSLLSEENRGFIIGLADDENAKNLKIKIKDVEYVPKSIQGLSFELLMAEQERLDGTEGFGNAKILPDLLVEDESYVQEFLSKKGQNYGSFTSTIKQGSQLRQGQSFIDILRQITNVAHVDKPLPGNVVFRGVPKITGSTFGGGGYPALFVLDGVPIGNSYLDLDYLRVEHIQSIHVIRSSAAVISYGTDAGGGVVVVKTGIVEHEDKDQLFTKQKLEQNLLNDFERAVSVDFFEPRRKFETNTDTTGFSMLKSTLFWTPKVIFDENGEARINYKNLDLPAKVVIRINGISEANQLGYVEKTYFSRFSK